ncbi:MAG: amylo-alpha-1,6-glucosidase [Bacteroidota bacterium]
MNITLNKNSLSDFNNALTYEYLETNGFGGWSSSTVINAHTRRYHALLMAAVNPPLERYAVVSKLEETLVIDGNRVELSTNLYQEKHIDPEGYVYIESFSKNYFPEWILEANGVRIKKTLAIISEANTVVITYEVLECDDVFQMELLPLLAFRDYHHLSGKNENVNKNYSFINNTFHAKPYEGNPSVYIAVTGSTFNEKFDWYNRFYYQVEEDRGQDCMEDLFTYGNFSLTLNKGQQICVIVSIDNISGQDAFALIATELERRKALVKLSPSGIERTLTLAADQFIVKRNADQKTVIAGYHWFGDWGRDTMISLPGLCLSTGRYDDAKKILSAFAETVSQGMLPNRFQDYSGEPEYNNVDGTLWYFIAIYKYLLATNDQDFVLEKLLPVLDDIINWHYKGTRYNIHVNSDGLLYSGENGVQLTWMDAKIDSWVVTPRTGKAVEINALWYNALMIYSELLLLSGNISSANNFSANADNVKKMFNTLFWNEEAGCLYDVVDHNYNDETIRPNQLLAISLPFQLVDKVKALSILNIVQEKLYTPVGLRSLDPEHPTYKGIYSGDQLHRDAAYHQGTVWSWLLGSYVDALMKSEDHGIKEANKVISNFAYHLCEAGLGTVSEIFDGNAPHAPRGCIAQAWSVAEILRVIKEYSLTVKTVIRKNRKMLR